MRPTQLIDQFQRARKNPKLAVIEGIQALKHAVRFKANIQTIATSDTTLLAELLEELAPDAKDQILAQAEKVEEATFAKLSPQPPRTKVIAIAQRKAYTLAEVDPQKPIVLLEDPRDLENIGAVIRVAAAADIAAVCITGPADIWHPAVIRGGAGLQYAIPVFNTDISTLKKLNRPLISLDPTGKEGTTLAHNSILVFGTERHGISQELLEQSNAVVRLPMKQGVSSLNLATSVAATLYKM